jgi:hypothetical protein
MLFIRAVDIIPLRVSLDSRLFDAPVNNTGLALLERNPNVTMTTMQNRMNE